MKNATKVSPSLLQGGFYTLPEASRILKIKGIQKIRNWLRETPSGKGPAVALDYKTEDGISEISFWDLLEIRFVNYFREKGVSSQSIRKAAVAARKELEHKHPFALSNVKFLTDRKRIFLESAFETDDKILLDLIKGQHVMYPIIEEYIAEGIEFDPSSGLAQRWHPEPYELPNIVIDPKIAHGRPSVEQLGIPTEALYLAWKAESENIKIVSKWFGLNDKLVKQAIAYEKKLAA